MKHRLKALEAKMAQEHLGLLRSPSLTESQLAALEKAKAEKKAHGTFEKLQADLDLWIDDYNRNRPHQGRWCFGKTPMQTLLDSLSIA